MVLDQPSPKALAQARQWVHSQILDAGEAEALAYAQEIHADGFITDDTAARTLAESLGLQVRGTLGVVLYAAAGGHMDEATSQQTLARLERNSTLWMSAKVRTAARMALSKIFE